MLTEVKCEGIISVEQSKFYVFAIVKEKIHMYNFKIRPAGMLHRFIETQMDGLTGNIEAAGYPFNISTWGNPDYIPKEPVTWWPFEQTGYWIDGYTRCAILLDDKKALEKAEKIIYSAINSADEDSYIGPDFMKHKKYDDMNRWSHVVFFRACKALFEYNGDMKIPQAIAAHYLNCPYDYSFDRDVLNTEIMLWIYDVTGDKRLLSLAEKSYADFNSMPQKPTVTGDVVCDKSLLSKRKMFVHGVSYCEYSKLGAIFYKYTGNEKYLKVSEKAVARADRYYKLAGGCISSGEMLRGDGYDEVTETCDVADYSYFLEQLFSATENIKYADDIEKCVFNAGIGAVTEDFRALQYFSCTNQIITNEQSNHAKFLAGNTMMSYSPHPGTQCCPGNVNRFMPNYILSMWHMDGSNVYYDLFGASVFEGNIDGKKVKISVDTRYPLSDRLAFKIETETPFALHIRVPAFSEGFSGLPRGTRKNGDYICVNIASDAEFALDMKLKIEEHRSHGGIYFTRGALTYSLGMKGNREAYATDIAGGKEFISYRMSPDKAWNYAIKANSKPKFNAGSSDVFDILSDLPTITVSARKVENWRIRKTTNYHCINWKFEKLIKKGPYIFTPKLPDMKKAVLSSEVETITLYPYGASKLRMTVLPVTDK